MPGCYLRRGCFLMGVGIAHHLAHHLPALALASMLMGSARSSLLWADGGVIRSLPKDDETKPDKDDVVFIAR